MTYTTFPANIGNRTKFVSTEHSEVVVIHHAINLAQTVPFYLYDEGKVCKFLRIDERWGFKLYGVKRDRNKCERLQSFAAKHGFAPLTGDKFEVNVDRRGRFFGYITECIGMTILDQYMIDNMIDDERYLEESDYEKAAEKYIDNNPRVFKAFNKLVSGLNGIGITTNDLHPGNVGFMKNGNLVCIDFSHEQMCKDG